MEGADYNRIKELFGDNFVGKEELAPFFRVIGLDYSVIIVPDFPFPYDVLFDLALKNYILILGISNINGNDISIRYLRDCFGIDPLKGEPCFYNQDWYLNEYFIDLTLGDRWYLIKREVEADTKGIQPENILASRNISFPSAILCTYTFYSVCFRRKLYLWKHDFIWCSDLDHNGDRIYVGKYNDVDGINKNGFSIHRYLSLKPNYGAIDIKL